jgi:hypothetical protein
LLLANGYAHSVMTGPTTPGLQAVVVEPELLPVTVCWVPGVQLPVLELQHMPLVHVSPGLHLFIGWHAHPSDPAAQSVGSTEPEAPAGTWHFPASQTPLAQSGPVEQVVFGNIAVGSHSPPVHLPLWQSLALVHDEPADEAEAPPELEPALEFEPPFEVEPPLEFEPPLEVEPSLEVEPPSFELRHTPPTQG